jgi:ABC-2 type transport system ATP-binding protein
MTPSLFTRPDGPAAVAARGLTKSFGAVRALDGLELTVPEGAVYVLVGPNSSGKTTTLRTLVDLSRPDAGSAEVFGMTAAERGPEVRAAVGFVPETRDAVPGRWTVGRLLDHHARYFPAWDNGYAAELARRLEVQPAARFGTLSKGQARRAQLVLALAHRPPLLLLDEPTDGLDPLARDEVLGLLADHLAASPTTVLVSTHRVHEVEGLGDWLGVMRSGRLTAQLERGELSRRLHRLRAEVPEGWAAPPAVEAAVVRRPPRRPGDGPGREIGWTVWGEPAELTALLGASGATVRSLDPLNLEQAALALLAMEER